LEPLHLLRRRCGVGGDYIVFGGAASEHEAALLSAYRWLAVARVPALRRVLGLVAVVCGA